MVPESSGIKDTANCKAARTAGPRSRLRGGPRRNHTQSIHVCMLTPHMPPLHPILYTQTYVCTPHPQIHSPNMMRVHTPHTPSNTYNTRAPAKYTHHTRTNVTHLHTHSRHHTPHQVHRYTHPQVQNLQTAQALVSPLFLSSHEIHTQVSFTDI